MKTVNLIYRVYMVEPKIKQKDSDLPIELILIELNDGYGTYRNQFETHEEAIHYLQNSSNVKSDREYIVIPSCKVRGY